MDNNSRKGVNNDSTSSSGVVLVMIEAVLILINGRR